MEADIRQAIADRTWWYRNCVRQRKNGAKICNECPMRAHIEGVEHTAILNQLAAHCNHEGHKPCRDRSCFLFGMDHCHAVVS